METQPAEVRLVRLREVVRTTGFCKSTIYNMVRRGDFPQPKKIGRTSVWPSTQLERWVAETPVA